MAHLNGMLNALIRFACRFFTSMSNICSSSNSRVFQSFGSILGLVDSGNVSTCMQAHLIYSTYEQIERLKALQLLCEITMNDMWD